MRYIAQMAIAGVNKHVYGYRERVVRLSHVHEVDSHQLDYFDIVLLQNRVSSLET